MPVKYGRAEGIADYAPIAMLSAEKGRLAGATNSLKQKKKEGTENNILFENDRRLSPYHITNTSKKTLLSL